MKKTIKRILAIICCIAVVLTGISANNILDNKVKAAQAAETVGTLTITSEGTSIPFILGSNAGYLNMGYSTDVTDYGNYGDDFLTAAFVGEYVTFGGGMTSTDLMNGKFQFVIATNNILQFNWNQRSTAFKEGWSFTIAQGAPISYRTTTGALAYLALAKEYTFTFRSGDSTCDNYVDIAGYYVSEFSLGGLTLWGNGLEGTSEIYFGSNLTKTPGSYTYKEMQNDAAYADYIRIANKAFEELDGDVRLQYIVSDGAQCFQFKEWGSLRTAMTNGDRMTFYKGLPIYYTDVSGVACKAILDATYVYECVGSNAQNTQTFLGVKLDDTTKYGLKLNATGQNTDPQQSALGNEQYVNLWFDAKISALSSHAVSKDILADTVAEAYVQVADFTMKQVKNLGMAVRFIPNADNGCLQVAFSEAMVDALQEGDTIVFKEGMPVVYVYNGALYAATLDTDYVIIVNANDGTTLNVSYTLTDTYSLAGSVNGPGTNEDKKYYDIPIESETFADATSGTNGSFGDEWKEYLTLSAHDTSAFTADNARMNWYLIDGYRIVRPYTDLTFADGEVLMIKKGLPFTYTTTAGKAKTVYLDKDYGFVYSTASGAFTYDPTLKSESEPIEKVTTFGLDTVLYGTWEEVGNQVFNNSITGNPFDFETVYRKELDEAAETVDYLDYSACTDADKVKKNTNIIFILADANTQVIQVQFTPEAIAALEVGDKIVLRKGMPVSYSKTDAEAVATLDEDYALVITEKNGNSVTVRTELIGNFSLRDVFYHAPEGINYTDVPYASAADLADAIPMDSVRLDEAVMRDYLEISGKTYEELLAKGYYLQVFTIDAFRGIRINYSQLEFQPGDVIIFKEGLPLTYTTTSGKIKTVYLDDTYGYRKNEQTAFVYDATLKEIIPPEIIEFGFGDNEGAYTNAHDDYMGFNLPLSGGALETSGYLYPDFLADATNYSYIEVEGYSTQELRSQGFEVLFLPSVGVVQIIGTLEWEEGMQISLKKGMSVSYVDGNAKQAVLDDDYSYQIVKENGVFVLKKADYFVTVTVDGKQCLADKYKFGTELDLSQYKNEEKGKVMAIKVNGQSIADMTVVVNENLQIEIENRSDICIVVFRDNGKTCAVREYKLTDKDIKIPYAPDVYGYDDSWEAFELVNGTIYVDAIHTEKQLHPIVKLSGVEVENPDTNQNTSPKTGDFTAIGIWLICGVMAMMLAAWVLVDKKKKASER